MQISVQYAAEDAVTADERSRVWTHGPDTGTFYNSVFIQTQPVVKEDGSLDFTDAYLQAMKEFLIQEPRTAEGKAFKVSIIA